ncbi:hypothetical protein L596_027452 [Steinernema carpocapsae]|nr:hypothetical protein L596_027452 [Steinernema carpocapsae]
MDVDKADALTEWFNIFGDLVGLPHVNQLGEFVGGQHLPTILKFMKEKSLPKKPAEKILNRREFFESLLSHLTELQKVSPNQYHSELKSTAASYGQSDEIAKFLSITLYEIRMDPQLQAAAFDVIVPKLSAKNSNELEIIMDYLDDNSQWPSVGNWSEIIKKSMSENVPARETPRIYATPSTPKRLPFRDLNKTVPGRPYACYSTSGEISVLNDSPKLRENRQRRHIQDQDNQIRKLKSELNEMTHEYDQMRISKPN